MGFGFEEERTKRSREKLERESEMKWERGERREKYQKNKKLIFIIQYCYITILHIRWYCSKIVNFFAMGWFCKSGCWILVAYGICKSHYTDALIGLYFGRCYMLYSAYTKSNFGVVLQNMNKDTTEILSPLFLKF